MAGRVPTTEGNIPENKAGEVHYSGMHTPTTQHCLLLNKQGEKEKIRPLRQQGILAARNEKTKI